MLVCSYSPAVRPSRFALSMSNVPAASHGSTTSCAPRGRAEAHGAHHNETTDYRGVSHMTVDLSQVVPARISMLV